MINKENIKEEQEQQQPQKKDSGFTDVAKMEVQCHLVIKDTDTGKELVNKRG